MTIPTLKVKNKRDWPKKIVAWEDSGTIYLSIPFTWLLPSAFPLAVFYKTQGYAVRAGGPAVKLMPDYLRQVANVEGEVEALSQHNPYATFTSRGCIRSCKFCAVPRIEGDLQELRDWAPRPIVCDNNLLACSCKHFDTVIDRLKSLKGIDFNQGLDARLLNDHHIDRLCELDLAMVRLAWDDVRMESIVLDAIAKLTSAGIPSKKIRVYVLVGFRDTPDDALYRCETLKQLGVLPSPQRFQPLDTLHKNSYVGANWAARKLQDFCRYWSRQNWLGHIPFAEYKGVK